MFWGHGTQHVAGIFGICVLKVPSFLLTCPCSSTFRQAHHYQSLMVRPLSMAVPSSTIVAVDGQAWGKDSQTPTGSKCSLEHMKARRRHRSENGDSVSSPLLLPSDCWMKLLCVRLDHVGAPNTGTFSFILSLLYMVGVAIYVNVHACALCQWPHPCRLDRLFHESFLCEISILLPWKFPAIR